MSGAATGSGRSALVRGGLGILSVQALVVGLRALFLPRSFYEDFPSAGREWVSASGPYNGHLLADVGTMYLVLGVLLAVAAVSLDRDLMRASLATWLAFVGFVVLPPLVLLFLDGLRRAVDGCQAEVARGG